MKRNKVAVEYNRNKSMSKRETKHIGDLGESIACKFLLQKGYKIVERNFRIKAGEIDIIAKKGPRIHFVEVKAVSRESAHSAAKTHDHRPEELVHSKKVRKIRAVAEFYLVSREISLSAQIDVVAVEIEKSAQRASCRLIEHAEWL